MRNKRWIGLAVLLLAFGLLSGCGKKEIKENIAVIREAGEQSLLSNAIEETASQYAGDKGLILKTHKTASGEEDDYMVAVQEAADGGASVVIGYGEKFEIPLYTMQKKYKKIKFIIVEGSPRKKAGKDASIRKNTRAITFNEAEGGFLAGYAAVMEGNRNLGFMGGKQEESTAMYGSGFVQGAEYAAKKLKLGEKEVNLRYAYMATNEISPSLSAQASKWYSDGCQVIFSAGGSIPSAVMRGAEASSGKVIGSDRALQSQGKTNPVLTSAIKNLHDIVYDSIGSVFDDSFEGKTEIKMDAANGGVGLDMANAQFSKFNESDYKKIVKAIKSGKVKVKEVYVSKLEEKEKGLAHIAMDYKSNQ